MNIIEVNPPRDYRGLEYPVGDSMGAVRLYAETLAPYVDQLVAKAESESRGPILVCRGSSGAMLTSALSMFMNARPRVFHVKKDGEDSHSHHSNYVRPYGAAYIVVDDFVDTGRTLVEISKAIHEPKMYGLVLGNVSAKDATKRLERLDGITFDNLINLNVR